MSERFESSSVPFIKFGNRRCLTDEQLREDQHLADFVKRFDHCFEYDPLRRIHLFIETGQQVDRN